jgi:hypothetical protein
MDTYGFDYSTGFSWILMIIGGVLAITNTITVSVTFIQTVHEKQNPLMGPLSDLTPADLRGSVVSDT